MRVGKPARRAGQIIAAVAFGVALTVGGITSASADDMTGTEDPDSPTWESDDPDSATWESQEPSEEPAVPSSATWE